MVKLSGPFSQLNPVKILVAGDLLLDIYTIGKAKRISPEAPVAILNVDFEEQKPGGAGNVILNLASLGAQVVPIGRIGTDIAGESLKNFFINENISVEGIFSERDYRTPIKNRLIAEHQQIVRVDYEKITSLDERFEEEIIAKLPDLFSEVQMLAISDYGKGFLTPTLIASLITEAKKKNIPIITDPKGTDFHKYNGSTILKPNLGEAYAAANLSWNTPLEQVAKKLHLMLDLDVLMITRSEDGISLFYKNGTREDFPIEARAVKDVTGAGDSVLAVMAIAVANQLSLSEATQLSNIAGGIAVEHLGCARITLSELARRVLKQDVANKVFDQEHLFTLTKALEGTQFSLLVLNSQEGFNAKVYQTIRHLSQQKERSLVIFLKDSEPQQDYLTLLSSLAEVSFILIEGSSLESICEKVHPSEVYIFEKQTLKKIDSFNYTESFSKF